MPQTVHSYVRKRGTSADDPVELNYLATGRHLQEDLLALSSANLPKPDLLRGVLRCASLAEASGAVRLGLHGISTREVKVDDGDAFYSEHPEFLGPPRIQLRPPRPSRPT